MDDRRMVVLASLAIGAGILVIYASKTTGDKPVPQVQSELQMMGLNVSGNLSFNTGTPLDTDPKVHFWDPGWEPAGHAQVVTMRHRYPSVPGGNMSSVMHKGWGAFNTDSPEGNDWRITPPEEAIV